MNTKPRPDGCCTTPLTPTTLSSDRKGKLFATFKALADPNRLEIFRLIAAQVEPICVCDVVDRFTLTQPTISHHLKVLREAGLILVTRRGVWAYYAADPAGLTLLRGAFGELVPVGEVLR